MSRRFGVCIVLLALSRIAGAQESVSPKPIVVVVDFATDRTVWMPPPQFGATLADLLTDRLIADGTFRVIDRAHAPAAVIDYTITGAVTRLSIERRSSTGVGLLPLPIGGGLLRKHTTTTVIGLALRAIDARSGEVVATSVVENGASDRTTGGGALAVVGHAPVIAGKSSSATGFQDRLLDAAAHDVVAAAATQIVATMPKPRVR